MWEYNYMRMCVCMCGNMHIINIKSQSVTNIRVESIRIFTIFNAHTHILVHPIYMKTLYGKTLKTITRPLKLLFSTVMNHLRRLLIKEEACWEKIFEGYFYGRSHSVRCADWIIRIKAKKVETLWIFSHVVVLLRSTFQGFCIRIRNIYLILLLIRQNGVMLNVINT